MTEKSDVILERAVRVIKQRAEDYGVELVGKVSIQSKNGAFIVRQGIRQLGRLTLDEVVRCDVDRVFCIHRTVQVEAFGFSTEQAGYVRAAQDQIAKLKNRAIDELLSQDRRKERAERKQWEEKEETSWVDECEDLNLDHLSEVSSTLSKEKHSNSLACGVIASFGEQEYLRKQYYARAKKVRTRLEKEAKEGRVYQPKRRRSNGKKNGDETKKTKPSKTKWDYRSELVLAGSTCAVAGNQAYSSYTAYKQDLTEAKGLPRWKGGRCSVPIRADSISINKEKDENGGDRYVCRFDLMGTVWICECGKPNTYKRVECFFCKKRRDKKTQPCSKPVFQCYVLPKGAKAWSNFHKVWKKEWKLGDSSITWRDDDYEFRINLCYSKPRPLKQTGSSCMVVRRNVQHLFIVMSDAGKTYKELDGYGLQVLHKKRYFLNQKRKMQKVMHAQKGGRGHGKKRYMRPYDRLAEKETRSIDAKLHEWASRVRKLAQQDGVYVIYAEDMSTPWNPDVGDKDTKNLLKKIPWQRALTFLQTQLEAYGIQLKTTASAHNLSECPNCESKKVIRENSVHCTECDLLMHREMMAAWNILKTVGFDTTKITKEAKTTSKWLKKSQKKVEGEDE